MKTQIFANFVIFVVAMVVAMVMTFNASAQQPPAGATQLPDGRWQAADGAIWSPLPAHLAGRTVPRAVPQVSIQSLPAPTRVYAPTSSAPVPVSSYQTATGVGAVTSGISGHLNSYARPQEVVGQQELRVEESRSGVYLDAARQDANLQYETNRFQIEQQRLLLQRERDLNRLALEQQEQRRRTVESWSRVIRDGLNDASRRASQRQRDELRARQQRQDELQNLSREAQRWVELQHRAKD